MPFELNKIYDYSESSLIEELQRVSKLTDKHLTRFEFRKYGKVSSDTIIRKFGGWKNALEKAGLSHRYSGRIVSEKMKTQVARNLNNNDLLNELLRVANDLNKTTLSQVDFNHNSDMSASVIARRYGNWSNALKKAGLEEVKMAKRYSTKDYFENILSVWINKGRQPIYREMNDYPSVISAGAYEKKFSKWSFALMEFIKYTNLEFEQNNLEKTEPVIKSIEPKVSEIKKDRRDISLGLRYKVLSRDKFKCVKCGNSPSVDPKCTLHIDHIIPWSKGGRTELENLQTACKECNIGKGNRFNE